MTDDAREAMIAELTRQQYIAMLVAYDAGYADAGGTVDLASNEYLAIRALSIGQTLETMERVNL